MGFVHATLELANGWEAENARRGLMDKDEVRRMHVESLVDTGSFDFCINEVICEALRLPVDGRKRSVLANGEVIVCHVAGPVIIRFSNRECMAMAMVLPGDNECLLGALAMEAMDVLVDPRRQELIVNPGHPDFALHRIGGIRPLP